MTKHWVEILYSNQKAINYISPSSIRASVETRPRKLHNLLQFSAPSLPDVYGPPPPPSPAKFCDTRISSSSRVLCEIERFHS